MPRAVGGLDVDVVHADGVVRDRPQARGGVDQLGVDAVGEQREQALGLAHAREQLVARRRQRLGPDLDLVLGGEPIERAAGQRAGDEHLHRCGSMPRPGRMPRREALDLGDRSSRGAAGGRGAGLRPERRDARPGPRRPVPGGLSRRRRRPQADRPLDGARGGAARRAAGAAGDGRPGRVGPAQPQHARATRSPGSSRMHRSLNKGDYRGFPRNPELQLLWFLDTAVIVRQREIAEGAEDYGTAVGRLRALDRRRGAPGAREPRRLPALLRRRRRAADRVLPAERPHPGRRAARAAGLRRARASATSSRSRARCPREACMVGARAEPRPARAGGPRGGVGGRAGRRSTPAARARGARRSWS